MARKHIKLGYLVWSTNEKQMSCIRILNIVQKSERLSSRRLSRNVVKVEPETV
jgi:hypothetical protein